MFVYVVDGSITELVLTFIIIKNIKALLSLRLEYTVAGRGKFKR